LSGGAIEYACTARAELTRGTFGVANATVVEVGR
jgi:hypothetical protein